MKIFARKAIKDEIIRRIEDYNSKIYADADIIDNYDYVDTLTAQYFTINGLVIALNYVNGKAKYTVGHDAEYIKKIGLYKIKKGRWETQ